MPSDAAADPQAAAEAHAQMQWPDRQACGGKCHCQNQKAPYGLPQSAWKAALPQNCLNCKQNCPPVREICKYVSCNESVNKRGGQLFTNKTCDWTFVARVRLPRGTDSSAACGFD